MHNDLARQSPKGVAALHPVGREPEAPGVPRCKQGGAASSRRHLESAAKRHFVVRKPGGSTHKDASDSNPTGVPENFRADEGSPRVSLTSWVVIVRGIKTHVSCTLFVDVEWPRMYCQWTSFQLMILCYGNHA